MDRRWLRVSSALALVLVGLIVWTSVPRQKEVRFIVGRYKEAATSTPAPAPPPTAAPVTVLPSDPVYTAAPSRVSTGGQARPVAFREPDTFFIPPDLRFFLVISSDARPGQDMLRARADGIHVVAVDPVSRKGTVLGIPRDSYVDIPGHGKGKINAALVYGGPELLVQTVREATGLPISFYAVTGFEGLVTMVDELQGVDVYVPYDMDDHWSGAHFSEGWHHMDGPQVLAFSRARKGVPGGDFGRSENIGRVILHSLEKMRAETTSRADIRRWLGVLYAHAQLDMSMADALELGVLARQIFPADLVNVVTPGEVRTIGGQSVVVLGEEARALFRDVAANAVADGSYDRYPPAPPPTPEPTPTPAPILGDLPVPAPQLLPGL